MRNSNLFAILKTFTPGEFKEFRKLAGSLYFNKEGEYITRFLDYLKKFHPSMDDSSLERTVIFKKLYPSKKYDDAIIRKLSSVSQKLAEEYLIQSTLTKKENARELLLMEALSQRSLGDIYEKKMRRLAGSIYRNAPVNGNYFANAGEFERNVYSYYLTNPRQYLASEHHIKYGSDLIIDTIIKVFKLFHDLSISRTNHNQFLDTQVIDVFLDSLDIEKVLKFIDGKDLEQKYIISIYYYVYKATADTNDNSYYFRLKELILSNFDKFDTEFKNETLTFFINNICTDKIRLGDRDFYYEIFDNYKFILSHRLHLNPRNNYFHPALYRAILITASSIKEFEWLENFIEIYKQDLQPDLRENMFNYAKGNLYYHKKEYETALKYFNKVSFEIFLFKLDVKNLTLMIYYELGYIEEALSLIDTYKHFLNENSQLSENIKEIAENFVNFVKSMIKIKNKGSMADAAILNKKISETAIVGFKFWLLEKTAELESSLK